MGLWAPRLTPSAERDIDEIVAWTLERFGEAQARTYREVILAVLQELERGPDPPGAKKRDDLIRGVRTLHVARRGRRGSHVVLFRVMSSKKRLIEILRVLHQSMDFAQHLPDLQADEDP